MPVTNETRWGFTVYQKAAAQRLRDAQALLNQGCYWGACYIGGYAVECVFKYAILKLKNKHHLDELHQGTDANPYKTHNLLTLIDLESQLPRNCPELSNPRAPDYPKLILHEWTVDWRYKAPDQLDRAYAEKLIDQAKQIHQSLISL